MIYLRKKREDEEEEEANEEEEGAHIVHISKAKQSTAHTECM
jgi:hypothetical protein